MSDYQDPYSDPTQSALLDWVDNQSKTAAGKPQYGATQLTTLSKLLALANNPQVGLLSGGYDPMSFVPQQPQQQPQQVPFGATDYAVNAYKQRYAGNQQISDVFNQIDQGVDQGSLNSIIDNAADDLSAAGLTPDDVKQAANGYYQAKADQQMQLAKSQYNADGTSSSGAGGGGGGSGAMPYGADGLPSKSNYFGLDPTLGSQLEQYVPPEQAQVQQNAMADYMARGKALADQNEQSATAYDQNTAAQVGQAQGQSDAGLMKFLSDLNAPHVEHVDPMSLPAGTASAINGQQFVDNHGIGAHSVEEAQQPVDLGNAVKAFHAANNNPGGGYNGYDLAGVDEFGRTHQGAKDVSLADLYGQFSRQGRHVGEVQAQRKGMRDKAYSQSRDDVMNNYAQRAQKQQDWVSQMVQRRTGRQPETVLQHNTNQRLMTLLSLGLG